MPRGLLLLENSTQVTLGGLRPWAGKVTWPIGEQGEETEDWTMPSGPVVHTLLEPATLSTEGKDCKLPEEVANTYPIRWTGSTLWVRAENYAGMHGRDDAVFTVDTARGNGRRWWIGSAISIGITRRPTMQA